MRVLWRKDRSFSRVMLRRVIDRLRLLMAHRRERAIQRAGGVDWRDIPVIINNRDRLIYPRQLVEWLERAGTKRIVILDNASTYPALLCFYRQTRHRVIRLDDNLGHLALWRSDVFEEFKDSYFVYTDPDVLPDESCPGNAVEHMLQVLQGYPSVSRVGFGLRIDDLPEGNPERDEIVRWERRFWQRECGPGLFLAAVDTTFAFYRPYLDNNPHLPSIRTGPPYVARHLPWYQKPGNVPEDEQYYRDRIAENSTWWTGSHHIRDKLLQVRNRESGSGGAKETD